MLYQSLRISMKFLKTSLNKTKSMKSAIKITIHYKSNIVREGNFKTYYLHSCFDMVYPSLTVYFFYLLFLASCVGITKYISYKETKNTKKNKKLKNGLHRTIL